MDKKISNKIRISENELEILGLYLEDYSTKKHVREIARDLKMNHKTISLALQNMEKVGVVSFNISGKNKVYCLNIKNPAAREYLKNAESFKTIKLIEKHFIIKRLLIEIMPLVSATPVILFGSYSKGIETKESDIDILLIKDKNEQKIITKIKEFEHTYNKRIQLQKTTKEKFEQGIKEKDHLIVEIIKNHVILNNADFFIDILWRHCNEK